MHKIKVGNSDLYGSRIILGCMRMDKCSRDTAVGVLRTAIESGINMFDHADIYGDGQSERAFSEAFARTGVNRQDVIIQSKCGIVPKGEGLYMYDLSKEHIVASVDGILGRLRTDYLDILLLHRPDPLMDMDEVAYALDKLVCSGKVRYVGLSNMHPMQIELLQRYVGQPFLANQLQFSPVHTGMIDCGLHVNMKTDASLHHDGMVLDYCRLHNITVQAWSPFQYGHIEGVFLNDPQFKRLQNVIAGVAKQKNVSETGIVTAWILRHPANMQMVIGSMNPTRVADICTAADCKLTREEWYDIYQAAGNVVP